MCERTAEIWLLRSSSLDTEAFGCARSELGRLDTPLQLLAAEPFPPRGWVTPSQASGLLASGSATGVPARRGSSFTSRDLQFESLAVLALLVGIGNGGPPSATSTCHQLGFARNQNSRETSICGGAVPRAREGQRPGCCCRWAVKAVRRARRQSARGLRPSAGARAARPLDCAARPQQRGHKAPAAHRARGARRGGMPRSARPHSVIVLGDATPRRAMLRYPPWPAPSSHWLWRGCKRGQRLHRTRRQTQSAPARPATSRALAPAHQGTGPSDRRPSPIAREPHPTTQWRRRASLRE